MTACLCQIVNWPRSLVSYPQILSRGFSNESPLIVLIKSQNLVISSHGNQRQERANIESDFELCICTGGICFPCFAMNVAPLPLHPSLIQQTDSLLIQFQTIRCLSVGAILGLKIWWHWCYLIQPSKSSQRVYSPNSLFWASFSTCIWRW